MPKAKENLIKKERFKVYNINSTPTLSDIMPSDSTTNQSAETPFRFTGNELIKEAQRIREFRGDESYALTSFLREVDIILPLFDNQPLLKQYVFSRIIVNKIQGPALDVIRTLGTDATWTDIKGELINNFGIKETYHQLYHQAISVRNYNVREYFIALRSILAKLNEKYEHDNEKPVEFSPKVNESIILRTFLDNIDPNLSSVVLSRNMTTLRDAFSLLETSGLIKEKIKSHSNNNNKNHNQHNFNKVKNNQQPLYKQNFQNSGQPRNYHSNHFSHQYKNYHNNHTHSNQFRQPPQNIRSNSEQVRCNRPEPMDIDHIEHEVNFHLTPPRKIYR